ncbi:MAG: 4-alpha-glucanotransferase [Candidatus Omnitrophota bacterium]
MDFSRVVFARQWKRIGTDRKAGVCTPLFSVYSRQSVGIGELPDVALLADWCARCGFQILQLLPINDVGFSFRPYDAESSIAVDPMHLSLEHLVHASAADFADEIRKMRVRFKPKGHYVDYGIKRAKLELLIRMFRQRQAATHKPLENYRQKNRFWLRPYCAYKALKDRFGQAGWTEWPSEYRHFTPKLLERIEKESPEQTEFHAWLQYQAHAQLVAAKQHAHKRGVFLMGDLPFLVSRDSADVWSNPGYFKLNLASGAPPDLYFADGQMWGMPPYNWERIEAAGYDYLIEKLKAAENFYDLYRIDHFVGLFRVWTFSLEASPEARRSTGAFDPADSALWEEHGRKILRVMAASSSMLPCAEDLGVIPECSARVLEEFGICGMDIQRWARDWGNTYEFKTPAQYRVNSAATVSTHDMTPVGVWWNEEAGTVDEASFRVKCAARGFSYDKYLGEFFEPIREAAAGLPRKLRWRPQISSVEVLCQKLGLPKEELGDFTDLYLGSCDEREKFCRMLGGVGTAPKKSDAEFVAQCLLSACQSESIFSIQLVQDWLSMTKALPKADPARRINFPGIVNDANWRLRLPVSLEQMSELGENKRIHAICKATKRLR